MNRRSPFKSTAVDLLDATANLHTLATSLGTEQRPVPPTVSSAHVAVIRHLAAATLILLRPMNARLDEALPKAPEAA